MVEFVSDKLSRLLGDYRSDDDENDGTESDVAKNRDNTKTDTSEYQFCLISIQYHQPHRTYVSAVHWNKSIEFCLQTGHSALTRIPAIRIIGIL